jgi:HEAT repeat protein
MLDQNLDQAFEALKTYDWGTDRSALNPIDEAVVTTRDNADARKDLEARLAAVLATDVSRDAKDFVCRKLRVIGTAASVPALAALLPEKDHSHMARYALERMPAAEAAQAMRDSLPTLSDELKVGVIGSLGVRRDTASVATLGASLSDADEAVACAAACALGDIRSAEAIQCLTDAKSASANVSSAITDALLASAEGLLADGKKVEALAVYKRFVSDDLPKHVRLAATRGVLACAGKTE